MGVRAQSAKGRYAAAIQWRSDDPVAIENARRDLAVANVHDFILKTHDTAPPFTQDQRMELAALILSGDLP